MCVSLAVVVRWIVVKLRDNDAKTRRIYLSTMTDRVVKDTIFTDVQARHAVRCYWQ